MVRICDCGEKNPVNARKCRACGEDLSDAAPVAETEGEKEPARILRCVLSSLDGLYVYEVPAGGILLGRENAMSDYLASKIYVSRAHARIVPENGGFFIENLSSTNYTYLNNQKISDKAMLKDGDELGLGGTSICGQRQAEAAYFLVRIGECM